MPAAAVGEHQFAHRDGVAAVEDRLADREHRVLLLTAPHHVHRDVALREHRVDDEAVAGVDGLLATQVEHHEVVVDPGDALDLVTEQFVLGEEQFYPLVHVGQRQDLLDAEVPAPVDQHHHQLVVRDAEFPEAAQAGAGVHQEGQQFPALRVQDVLAAEAGGVGLVHGCHHLGADPREACGAAEVIVDHSRRALGFRLEDVIGSRLAVVAGGLAGMVVEAHGATGHVRQVGQDVAIGHRDLAVLHVLGVLEDNLAKEAQFLEQHGAHEAIHVAAGDETIGAGQGIHSRLSPVQGDGGHDRPAQWVIGVSLPWL